MKIVIATENQKKVNEMIELARGSRYQFIPQSALGISSIDETGLSFIENAIIKARHASLHSKLPALADDSGLVVPSLQGEPGIFSARYSGKNANDQSNILKLLLALKDKPIEERKGFYYCVLVYLKHEKDPTPLIAEGIWHGQILSECVGTNGFGYDPIFFVPELSLSAAELSLEKKNQMSHRGQALKQLLKKLSEDDNASASR